MSSLQKGEWLLELEDWRKYTCSNCGWSKRTDIQVNLDYEYCPRCGSHNAEIIMVSDKPE